MCSAPLAVGGGVSMDQICARSLVRSKVYVPCSAQTRIHLSSRPSTDGLSGMFTARCSGAGLVMGRFSQTATAPGESVFQLGPLDFTVLALTRRSPASFRKNGHQGARDVT